MNELEYILKYLFANSTLGREVKRKKLSKIECLAGTAVGSISGGIIMGLASLMYNIPVHPEKRMINTVIMAGIPVITNAVSGIYEYFRR